MSFYCVYYAKLISQAPKMPFYCVCYAKLSFNRKPLRLKKNASNDQAGIQQEHKATTTNVIKKSMHPVTRPASNKNARPQRPMGVRKNCI